MAERTAAPDTATVRLAVAAQADSADAATLARAGGRTIAEVHTVSTVGTDVQPIDAPSPCGGRNWRHQS